MNLIPENISIKAIVGLGNPGPRFNKTRHNVGFAVVDAIADKNNATWSTKGQMEIATAFIHDKKILLIKPQTFMNSSGQIFPDLKKQGIQANEILVVHDELDIAFGLLKWRFGGSARGHNGLKSIINFIGADFLRFRFGIDRPINKEDVPDYVLQKFTEPAEDIEHFIQQAVMAIEDFIA
jgi:PTH1 family peptidyl-tRNA hydrolase